MTQAETELCARLLEWPHENSYGEICPYEQQRLRKEAADTIERIAAERDEAQRSVAATMGLQEGTALIVKRLEAIYAGANDDRLKAKTANRILNDQLVKAYAERDAEKARAETLQGDIDRLVAALKSARARLSEQSSAAKTADTRRIALEETKVHSAFAIDVQEHRNEAYQSGQSDGYAEAEGKYTAERDAEKARAEDWINTAREWNSQREALLKRVEALEAWKHRATFILEGVRDNDPADLISDTGHTVFDGVHADIRTLLEQRP